MPELPDAEAVGDECAALLICLEAQRQAVLALMLLSLISEVARHADVIRETLDGRTADELIPEAGTKPGPAGN